MSDPTQAADSTVREERLFLPNIPLSTRVLKSGRGSPVLLLHGSPDSATEWRLVMDGLGDACSCFAPDLPGLGQCEEPPVAFDYSREANCAFIAELLIRLSIAE